MARGKIVIKSFGGRINIARREAPSAPVGEPGRPNEVARAPDVVQPSPTGGPTKKGVVLSSQMIQLMEIRAESIFRPNEDDYEITYALSGGGANAPDMLHNLASNMVVSHATPVSVQPNSRAMVDHVLKERSDSPKIFVDVHTHPSGIPEPSEADKSAFESAGPFILSLVPGTKVLFAVHAVSRETVRAREAPSKSGRNRIRWTSITREHEIAFFDEHSAPVEVHFDG